MLDSNQSLLSISTAKPHGVFNSFFTFFSFNLEGPPYFHWNLSLSGIKFPHEITGNIVWSKKNKRRIQRMYYFVFKIFGDRFVLDN